MGQMRPMENPGMSREGEGLLLEMGWVPWCWIGFFANNERYQHQGVRSHETPLALNLGHAESVSYTLGRIPGGPGDKRAVARMVVT